MAFVVESSNIFNSEKSSLSNNSVNCRDTYDILDKLYESQYNMFLNHTKAVYYGKKSKCNEILQESYIDILNDIDNGLLQIDSAMDDIYAKQIKTINARFASITDKIEKLKIKLAKDDIKFDVEGYTYTIDNIPDISFIKDYISDVNTDICRGFCGINEAYEFRNKIYDSEYIDKFKAKLIHVSYPFKDDTFSDAVIRKLRNNKPEPQQIQVDNKYLEDMIKRIPVLQGKLRVAAKEKAEIKATILKYRKVFKGGLSSPFAKNIPDSNDDATLTAINAYTNARCREATLVCNTVTTVYVEKIDAIKEELNFYNYLIDYALSSVVE